MTCALVRRRPAVFEGRNEPQRNVRRRRQIEARPIQALACLAALLPGHFAAFLTLSLTPAPPPFSPMTPARVSRPPSSPRRPIYSFSAVCRRPRPHGRHRRRVDRHRRRHRDRRRAGLLRRHGLLPADQAQCRAGRRRVGDRPRRSNARRPHASVRHRATHANRPRRPSPSRSGRHNRTNRTRGPASRCRTSSNSDRRRRTAPS